MSLFDFDAQHRETAAIWRLFQNMPLHYGLVDGRVFRWWAINIPLNLLRSSSFNGDIDLMVCTLSTPLEPPGVFYKTWETKLILVEKSGRPRSLKRGKTVGILNQLKIQRKFGSPDVSLLELYLHEFGSKTFKFFPTPEIFQVVERRAKELKEHLFGYQILPFTHGKNDAAEDFGVYSLENPFQRFRPSIELLRAPKTGATAEFLTLAQYLWAFAESESKLLSLPLGFVAITYCRFCRKLCLIHKRGRVRCYYCLRPFTGGHDIPSLTHLQLSKYLKG